MRSAVGVGGTRSLVDRLIHRTGTLLRRRGRMMLGAAGVTFVGGLAVLASLPSTYTARALVGPAAGRYDGPIERLVEQVLAPASLAAVASECEVRRHRTLPEMIAGAPADRVARLAPRVEVRGAPVEGVVVEAGGATRDAAVRAADLIAARLVAFDAADRARAGTADLHSGSEAVSSTSSSEPASSVPARVLLEQLRLRHPLLRDASPERRLHELAQRLSDDRIAVVSLEAQLDGLSREVERLARLVEDEADQAWRLELAERQAEAARQARAATPPASPAPPSHPHSAPSPSAPTSRIAELEAELALLLASRTSLHPDVRRLVRLIETERLRVTTTSGAASAGGRQARRPEAGPTREAPTQRAALPHDQAGPLVVPVADGPPDLGPPAGGPETWTQRVPSYPAWILAQHRAEEVQNLLSARRQEQEARRREHEALQQQLAKLRDPRLEEAHLLELVALEDEAARRPGVVSTPAPGPRRRAALVVLQGAGVHAERSPLRHLPGWALASIILPLLGGLLLEVRDRSVRGIEDVEGLGAPVLGVVPHLRVRGR